MVGREYGFRRFGRLNLGGTKGGGLVHTRIGAVPRDGFGRYRGGDVWIYRLDLDSIMFGM